MKSLDPGLQPPDIDFREHDISEVDYANMKKQSAMGDTEENWQQRKEEQNERKRKRRKSNTEIVMTLQGDMAYDFEVEMIAPYHLRITYGVDGRRLDFYPTSAKVTWVGSNEWFKISDIEKFIMENFKTK